MSNHSAMLDANGKHVKPGQSCRFWLKTNEEWCDGTVRNVHMTSYYNNFEQRDDVWEALVDDGGPQNPDLLSNGFRVAAWVESQHIEVKDDLEQFSLTNL